MIEQFAKIASKNLWRAGAALALCGVLTAPVFADDSGILQIDKNNWVTLDRFGHTQGTAATSDAAGSAPDQPAPSDAAAPAPASDAPKDTATLSEDAKPASETPAIALPARPLDLPVMPGISSHSVLVDRTPDRDDAAEAEQPAATAAPADGMAAIKLDDENWRNPADIGATLKTPEDGKPLPVRLSMLPNRAIMPQPSFEQASRHDRAALLKAQMINPAPVAPAPPQAQAIDATCKPAVDNLKKHQLEALASDRQTLAALQAAIAQLGLQKQLSFLTTPDSATAAASDTHSAAAAQKTN